MDKKNITILAALFTVALALIFFGLAPAANNINRDKHALAKEREQMNQLLLQGQGVNQNKNNLAIVEGQLAALESAYLKIGGELDFITDLEKIADKNGIEQKIDFNNNEAKEANGARAIPIGLQISGNLKAIMSYINDLEKLDYYINIETVWLSAGNNDFAGVRASAKNYEQPNDGEEPVAAATTVSAKLNGLTYWK